MGQKFPVQEIFILTDRLTQIEQTDCSSNCVRMHEVQKTGEEIGSKIVDWAFSLMFTSPLSCHTQVCEGDQNFSWKTQVRFLHSELLLFFGLH